MITKRKILAIFLSCLIVGSLMACSNADKNPTEPTGPFPDTTAPSEDAIEVIHGTDDTDNTIIIQASDETILVNDQEITTSREDVFLTHNETGAKIINIAKAGSYSLSGQLINSQILIDLGSEAEFGFKGYYLEHPGYIDHQSCEDYGCLDHFLNRYGVTLEQFIFDPNVTLITDNDNH